MRDVEITLGTIYKTGGRWRGAITTGYDGTGKRVRKYISAKTRSEVKRRQLELYRQLITKQKQPEKITVETWSAQWLEQIAPKSVSPRVLQNLQSAHRRHIVPALGKYKLADLGIEEVLELDRAVERSGVSGRTQQAVRSALSTCLDAAVEWGKMEANPCKRVKRPQARSATRTALAAKDAAHILEFSRASNDPLFSLWASYLLLGFRRAELIALEWDRLDLERGLVDLSWQVQQIPWRHGPKCGCREGKPAVECPRREHAVKPGQEFRELRASRILVRPKTAASIRMTPIPGPLLMVLRQHRDTARPNPYGLVWASESGLPLDPRIVTREWKKLQKAAGYEPVDLHSTRHTTASLLLAAGVPVEVIVQILGHSDVASTRRYAHLDQTMARAAMEKLGAILPLTGGV